MRRAPKVHWWIENGQFVGLCLSADHAAEHEFGVKDIEKTLGIPGSNSELMGIKRRTTTASSPNVSLCAIGKKLYLTLGRYSPLQKDKIKDYRQELYITKYGDIDDGGAWDDRSFGIVTENKEKKSFLKLLNTAFEAKDVVIYIGKSGPFQSGGLCILIASRVPLSMALEMKETDEDQLRLRTASSDTGIEAELKAAGRGWFALSPKWAHEITSTARGDIKTKYAVIYWLNPSDSRNDEYGWFTVEDLKLWVKGEGPCRKDFEKSSQPA